MDLSDQPLRLQYPEITYGYCRDVALRVVGPASTVNSDPDDLAQDVAIKFCDSADKGEIHFPKAWVQTVTINAVKRASRRRRRLVSLHDDGVLEPASEQSEDVEVLAVRKLLAERILRKTTPKQRRLVSQIVKYGSQKHSETAFALKTSQRALTVLKNRLKSTVKKEQTKLITEILQTDSGIPTAGAQHAALDVSFGSDDKGDIRLIVVNDLQTKAVKQPALAVSALADSRRHMMTLLGGDRLQHDDSFLSELMKAAAIQEVVKIMCTSHTLNAVLVPLYDKSLPFPENYMEMVLALPYVEKLIVTYHCQQLELKGDKPKEE